MHKSKLGMTAISLMRRGVAVVREACKGLLRRARVTGTISIIAGLVATCLACWAGPAAASDCQVDDYDHNGSRMEVQICEGEVFITYVAPKKSLGPLGVTSGTGLFEGRISSRGVIEGDAKLFSASCGEIAYDVTGRLRGESLVLSGQAPVRTADCRVSKYRNDELRFTMIGGGDDDWYAIAGAFDDYDAAQEQSRALGRGWDVVDSSDCPNFTPGYWISAAGPLSKGEAERMKTRGRKAGAYIKTCN